MKKLACHFDIVDYSIRLFQNIYVKFENIRRRDVSLFGGISCGKLVFYDFEMFSRQALD